MIAYLIEDYLSRHNMYRKDFADKLGFNEKTVCNWTKLRQVPTYFSAQCLLDLFLKDVEEESDKLAYEEMYWWIWETEYCWRVNKLRKDRGLESLETKRCLQHYTAGSSSE